MNEKKKHVDLINGPIFKSMILFSLPIILQGSFQLIYNIVDRYWVGQLPDGKEAIGAVSVGFSLFFFMLSLVIGIAMGAGIMIAQYRGAEDRRMTNLTARNFLAFGGIAVVVISVIMIGLTEPILRLLKTPESILADATIYMQWIFGGLIVFYLTNAITGVFRGLGDSATPVKVIALTTILNMILDPFFILGLGPFPQMGVIGAAIATVLSSLLGFTILLPMLRKHKEWVDLTPNGFRFDWSVITAILRLGLPTTATMIIVSSSIMVIQRFVNEIGVDAVAAFGVCVTLDQLLMMPAQSFSQAMSTIAGQCIGAGKWDRVDKYLKNTILVSVVIAVAVGFFLNLSIDWVAAKFLPDPADYDSVFPLVLIYVRIMFIRYLMMGLFFPIVGTIRGAGDTMMAMWLVMFTQLIIRIPVVWLSQIYGYGFAGIAVGLALSTIFGFLIVVLYYKSGRWKRFALINHNNNEGDPVEDGDIRPKHM